MVNEMIDILWDGSHLWGLLALHGIRALGLPCRLVRAKEIARKPPQGKGGRLLLAPGGNARKKAAALGEKGLGNIRAFVADGGVYLGFCGGAGLALRGEASLGLCPWTRAAYTNRLPHLVSGMLRAEIAGRSQTAVLPVWWPGRFAPQPGDGVEILARAIGPAEDFWLADIPITRLPGHVLAKWQAAQNPSLGFLRGLPLAVRGKFGEGSYILSYSHLETPECLEANAWLCSLLAETCALTPPNKAVPAWRPPSPAALPGQDMAQSIAWASRRMESLLRLGEDLRIFFVRASWLHGWRGGFPGMACNNLRLALGELARLSPTPRAEKFWQIRAARFRTEAEKFFDRAEECLSELKLLDSTGQTRPPVADIFGHPMLGGGQAEELLELVEELIYLCQEEIA